MTPKIGVIFIKIYFFYSFIVAVKLILTSTLNSIGPSSESAFPEKVIVVELLFTKASSSLPRTIGSKIGKTFFVFTASETFIFVSFPTTVLSNFKVTEGIVPAVFPTKSLNLYVNELIFTAVILSTYCAKSPALRSNVFVN